MSTHVWRSNPQMKVEVAAVEVEDQTLSCRVVRPINNVSYAVLMVNDYQSKNYVAVIDALDTLDISFRYGSDSWTKVFSGVISTISPRLTANGEVLDVGAWGLGNQVVKTHCSTSYGLESANPTLDTPVEVWDDLVDNYIEKSFTGGATGYSVTKDRTGGATPTITHLDSPYKSCFEVLNMTLDLITANQAGAASHQWFMDTGNQLRIRAIDNNANANWPEFWKSSESASTIEVTKDMTLYEFRKNTEEYANNVLLASAFRKPASDYWTELATPTTKWGKDANIEILGNVAIEKVGSICMSIRFNVLGGGNGKCWYPSAKTANWDLTAIGSKKTTPTLNFYARRSDTLSVFSIGLYTTNDANYYGCDVLSELAAADVWYHLSLPVGPYYDYDPSPNPYTEGHAAFRWNAAGAAEDWANIDYLQFTFESTNQNHYAYVDDIHFAGKIIREAKDTSEITANDEYQRVIRNDTAIDDSMVASDDTGTAAMLAYAELLRRSQTPIVGMIQIPLAVDLLPGQKVHVHACLKEGFKTTDVNAFRINENFRVIELTHLYLLPEPMTILNLTNDLNNAHGFGVPTRYSLLKEYAGALGHAEAKNLKTAGIDNLIPRLTKSY